MHQELAAPRQVGAAATQGVGVEVPRPPQVMRIGGLQEHGQPVLEALQSALGFLCDLLKAWRAREDGAFFK
jgi:hypothetical protein